MPMLRHVITSADENCSICLQTAEEQPLYTHAQDGQGRHYMHLSCAQQYLSTPLLLALERECPDCRVSPLEVPGWSPPRMRARWPLSVEEGLVGVSSAALIVMSLLARIGSVAAAALGNLGVAEVVSQMSHVYFKVGCVFGAAGVLMRFATHGIEGVQDLLELVYESFLITEPMANELGFLVLRVRNVFGALFRRGLAMCVEV